MRQLRNALYSFIKHAAAIKVPAVRSLKAIEFINVTRVCVCVAGLILFDQSAATVCCDDAMRIIHIRVAIATACWIAHPCTARFSQ